MKAIIITLFILTFFTVLTGCKQNAAPAGTDSAAGGGNGENDTLEINEKVFIALVNDIWMNIDEYLGVKVKYEGIFDVYTDQVTGLTYYYVIRYGPGCCGTDGNAGFEVVWDGVYPEDNDWVEVIGTIESYQENGFNYLCVNAESLTVLDERGAEYVYQ